MCIENRKWEKKNKKMRSKNWLQKKKGGEESDESKRMLAQWVSLVRLQVHGRAFPAVRA